MGEVAEQGQNRSREFPRGNPGRPGAYCRTTSSRNTEFGMACVRSSRSMRVWIGVMPASTALFRDMTAIRFQHPEWNAENCTACGKCYTVCPDTAIPGLVNEVTQVLDTVVARVRKAGGKVEHLGKAVRQMERHLRAMFTEAGEACDVNATMREAIAKTVEAAGNIQAIIAVALKGGFSVEYGQSHSSFIALLATGLFGFATAGIIVTDIRTCRI